ncbi:hypothetical protein FJZ22_01960 [Candidatus Pacearchaeota archaeon]|nr:hypothetical protein [Candidatus Pacearchaeota archaeon]
MKYNKLVRDKVPEIILKKEGKIPITHIAAYAEYHVKLMEKLQEEVEQFAKTGAVEELIDILELLDAIMIEKKISKRVVRTAQESKAKERGKFTRRIILDEA